MKKNGLIKDSAKINIYVNNKTKCIDSLNVDFSNIIKFTNLSSYELDKFYLEINYDKFNESGDIKIPDEYLNNAIDVNIIDAYISAEKYVKKIKNCNTFYYASAHSLLNLCKFLASSDVLSEDSLQDKNGEIQIMTKIILNYVTA